MNKDGNVSKQMLMMDELSKHIKVNPTQIRLHNNSVAIVQVPPQDDFYDPNKKEYAIFAIPADLYSQFTPGEKVKFQGTAVKLDNGIEIIKKEQILLTYGN